MLEKYPRKFQTDDENLKFAAGTLTYFHNEYMRVTKCDWF